MALYDLSEAYEASTRALKFSSEVVGQVTPGAALEPGWQPGRLWLLGIVRTWTPAQ